MPSSSIPFLSLSLLPISPTNRRSSLVSAPCIPHTEKTPSCALANSSSLCDDQDISLIESTPNTYVATLERLRREQAEGLWTPIPDVDSVTSPDFGWTKLASEDGYSLCPSLDQLSLDTQNQLDSPIDADRYDDQEDERAILDRTPRATVGSTGSVVKRGIPRPVFQANPLLDTSLFYDGQ